MVTGLEGRDRRKPKSCGPGLHIIYQYDKIRSFLQAGKRNNIINEISQFKQDMVFHFSHITLSGFKSRQTYAWDSSIVVGISKLSDDFEQTNDSSPLTMLYTFLELPALMRFRVFWHQLISVASFSLVNRWGIQGNIFFWIDVLDIPNDALHLAISHMAIFLDETVHSTDVFLRVCCFWCTGPWLRVTHPSLNSTLKIPCSYNFICTYVYGWKT